ncbi:hypothetical protein [Sphingomonas sp.]|uniref:hypothetical protein n=1 Tax=Sphingomonas sp. TaxID=28214 RepID=UPI003B3B078E
MKRLILATVAAGMVAPVAAEPFVFSGVVGAGAGYVTNPFLRIGEDGGSPSLNVSLAPVLTRTTPRGVTTVRGIYSREEYLRDYGHSDNALAGLSHQQQLNERLTVNGGVTYNTTTNPLIGSNFDPGISDPLTIGRRSRRLSGDAGFSWQPTATDTWTGGVNASRNTFSRNTLDGLVQDYNLYGANLAYTRSLDERTQIGLRVNGQYVDSEAFPDTQSLQPAVTLHRQISAIWTFDGNIGLIIQKMEGRSASTTVGFGGSLCGQYPRTEICFTADRQSSASGIGGLRRDLSLTTTVTHSLTERSRLRGYGSYRKSDGQSFQTISDVEAIQARLDYDYDVTQRLTVGVGGRYQRRDLKGQGSADSVAGMVNLSMKIGR